jgi:crotonobetainyl-CoA:carnitine CoA-transferase CaiB-like acyl-CoA transferase
MNENSQDLQCLAGIRVVDFTQFEAGTSCTEALAWLGAEVVKIENPTTGDPGRRLRPGKPDDDPWYFHMFNANKKSLAINLKSPRGLAIVKDMLKKADVTVENMAPGTIERLGLGYDEVKSLNPRIIFCSIQGFGTGSKYEKGLAFDMIAQAAGGMISVTGEPDRPPVKPGPSFGDTGTGMLMAVTILGALLERQRTGKGRRLQVAMQDAMLHYMRTCFAAQARSGKPAGRRGGKTVMGTNAPSGLYQCRPFGPNDWIYITTSRGNPEHWGRLMKLIGREELIDDPRYATGAARVERAGRRRLRHDGAPERSELRGARHHAGDAAPERAVQDARVAGARRRQASAHRAVAGPRSAHGGGADRVARDRRRGGRRAQGREGAVKRLSTRRRACGGPS